MPRLTKKNSIFAFTLVEMLIVIVIIGILAAAIIPKITGIMARGRDTKRIADLRNVQMAIEQYRMDNGELPLRTVSEKDKIALGNHEYYYNALPYYGYVSGLGEALQGYLSEIPKDPQKGSQIRIYDDYWKHGTNYASIWGILYNTAIPTGEYVYQIFYKGGMKYGGAALVAKVETPSVANWVFVYDKNKALGKGGGNNGGGWGLQGLWKHSLAVYTINGNWKEGIWDIQNLYLCSSIKKVKKGKEVIANATTTECAYSSEDQLYYLVKI